MKNLKRKFEDNEADIITELYARHFKGKVEAGQMSQTQRGATVEATQDSGLIGEDSCVDVGFNTEIDYMEADLNDRRSNLPKRISKSITGAPAPKVETYSKPL